VIGPTDSKRQRRTEPVVIEAWLREPMTAGGTTHGAELMATAEIPRSPLAWLCAGSHHDAVKPTSGMADETAN
jgi:hypothetical protein